jgi:CsoR family transcriptional regulator, copper-sensing transcriptional repressor
MTHHKKPEISKRLARIEGHVRGIQRMVDEDKGYPDVVQQISAVRAALDGVVEVMVQDLVEHYVTQSRDEKGKKVAIELKDTVSNIF